jgi:hypothetical protein
MASATAKKAAGTYIRDDAGNLPPVIRWTVGQCRFGRLARHVRRFCAEQAEMLDPSMVLVESLAPDCIHCRIPFKQSDHESLHPFASEVRFTLDPTTGRCQRI